MQKYNHTKIKYSNGSKILPIGNIQGKSFIIRFGLKYKTLEVTAFSSFKEYKIVQAIPIYT